MPGWSEFVQEHKNRALFWHSLWKSCNCPPNGTLADIRRRTRAQYHLAIRRVKLNKDACSANKMADSLRSKNTSEFWAEVRKMRGGKRRIPEFVDDSHGSDNISKLFLSKYDELYNSVSYDHDQMNSLKSEINSRIEDYCNGNTHCGADHIINVSQVLENIVFMKGNKHDGNVGHYSDHVIQGTRKLHVYLSLLFTTILSHGFPPQGMCISTLVPIPKNQRKSLHNSNNYRAIALSSILGKLIDRIILSKYQNQFVTSDYQYGFKKGHSTVHCTFVVNEIIQYYNNNNSDVYSVLLDASRAFDRVNYLKMFKLLLKRNLCPCICKFLINLYTSQTIRVKWGDVITTQVLASNGVTQGGVLSPILFIVYMDELLVALSNSGVGCHIGNTFCGSFGYADDVIILCPTIHSIRKMLSICEEFAYQFDVSFNSDKSKLLVFTKRRCVSHNNPPLQLQFMNGYIMESQNEKHLGNIIGHQCKQTVIDSGVNEFYIKVNQVLSLFSNASPQVRYKLFQTHCMSLYGSQLWDYEHKNTNKCCIAWRK